MMHRAAVAVGVFDGVHLGHQGILDRLVLEANRRGIEPLVLTFKPHPRPRVLEREGGLLMSEEERSLALRRFGAAWIVFLRFDDALKRTGPHIFFHEILLGMLSAQVIVVGSTHRFGHQGAGDATLLQNLAARAGVEAIVVPELEVSGAPVNSRRVRRLLLDGEIGEASTLLGRPYRLVGRVVPGSGAGGPILGYPTANLDPMPRTRLIPRTGVYGCTAQANGRQYLAVVNIGHAPTMPHGCDSEPRVEAHLLDAVENFYGQQLSLDFIVRLRDEQRFSKVDDLRRQIALDVGRIRSLLRLEAASERGLGVTTGSSDPSPDW
jgi:riboflavin kinase/FMN adenylyltransferase